MTQTQYLILDWSFNRATLVEIVHQVMDQYY